MSEFVKIRCCGDCVYYNFKKHKCNRGAKDEGTGRENFYRDCPLGIHDDTEIISAMNVAQDYDDCDQFVCSHCGIELQNWFRVERDEDDGDITHHEYVFRYCPNCGAAIDDGSFAKRYKEWGEK